ncbi:MAG: hypothetical protein U0872_15385 [Planctomycetaceae bacterium]
MADLDYPGQGGDDDERDGYYGRRDGGRDYRGRQDRDRDWDRDDGREINVNSATGLPDVAQTAIKEAGKNVTNFWQLVIVLILVGGMVIAGVTVVVICKYIIPQHLKAISDGNKELAEIYSERAEKSDEVHKEIARENIAAFERNSHEKDEQHLRTIQVLIDKDRADRKDFERKVGIKSP